MMVGKRKLMLVEDGGGLPMGWELSALSVDALRLVNDTDGKVLPI